MIAEGEGLGRQAMPSVAGAAPLESTSQAFPAAMGAPPEFVRQRQPGEPAMLNGNRRLSAGRTFPDRANEQCGARRDDGHAQECKPQKNYDDGHSRLDCVDPPRFADAGEVPPDRVKRHQPPYSLRCRSSKSAR